MFQLSYLTLGPNRVWDDADGERILGQMFIGNRASDFLRMISRRNHPLNRDYKSEEIRGRVSLRVNVSEFSLLELSSVKTFRRHPSAVAAKSFEPAVTRRFDDVKSNWETKCYF